MKKIISYFIFLFLCCFMLIPNCFAIFIHDQNKNFEFSYTGKAPTCTLSNYNITSQPVTVTLSQVNGYITQFKQPGDEDFRDAVIDPDTNKYNSEIYANLTFEIRYRDDEGNYGPVGTCSITNIDTEHPHIEFDPNSNSEYKKEELVTIKATDNTAITKLYYYITADPLTEPNLEDATVLLVDNKNEIQVPVNLDIYTGRYYIWALALDTAGNYFVKVSGDYLLDNTPPSIDIEDTSSSTNNISIKVESSDDDSGVDGYYYSTDNGETWTTKQSSGIYMFAGLENGTTYNIKVKVVDKAGNETISDPLTVTTADFGNITVSVDADTWSTFKIATIAFQSQTGVTYQYSTDGGNTWITITSDSTIKYTKNGTFTIKITDGVNTEIQEYPITHIDPIPVTINSFTAPDETLKATSIGVVVDAVDTGDDSERSEIKGYQYSCNNGTTYSDLITSNTYTCPNLEPDTEYTIKVKVFDNAGNLTESSVTTTTLVISDIFLDGAGGSDNNDGSSPTNAVKTFAKAKSLLEPGGVIWLCGKVTISTSETWDLEGYAQDKVSAGTIRRWDGTSVEFVDYADKQPYTDRMILVNANLKLTLKNIVFDGNKDNVTGILNSNIIATSGDLTIENSTFKNNKSPSSGVAIASRQTTSYRPVIDIKNSTFSGNEGISFGAANGTIAYDKGLIKIDNTTFDNNYNASSGVILSAFKSGILDRKLEITNSTFTNNSGDKGAISLDSYDTTVISDSIISNNSSNTNTIYLNGASSLTLNNTTVTNNTALNGGAIYMTNAASVLNVNDSELSYNTITGSGAAIYTNNGTLTINNTQIFNNEGKNGGGIYLNVGTATINNSSFTNNIGTYGGGLYINNAAAVFNVNNCDLNGNTVTSRGGAIYIGNGTVNINSVSITNNNADSLGSGIFFGNSNLNMQGIVNITGNNNSTTKGDLYLSNGKYINVTGDLTGSNIGIMTSTKPNASTNVTIAQQSGGYILPNDAYSVFNSNIATYETANDLYDSSNNRVILKLK